MRSLAADRTISILSPPYTTLERCVLAGDGSLRLRPSKYLEDAADVILGTGNRGKLYTVLTALSVGI